MAKKSIRLSYGAILRKKPGGNYYYRYQVNGCRKMISLLTRNKDQALKKAEELIPVVQATSTEVVAAHVEFAKRMNVPKRSLKLLDSWEYYSSHPERATPATVNEQLQYKSTYKEFLDWLDDPAASVSDVTLEITDRYCQYLKSTNIAVNTHNRKMKRLRRIFKAFHEFRDKQNPFDSPLLFRRQREEQELTVRRQAFTREQEQRILEVLDDNNYKVINKPELRVVYYLGMYTGQRLKDCVLLQWGSIDLEKRRIWVKQFKTGKEVTVPIADRLYNALLDALEWKSNEYVCPKTAKRYNHVDKNGKNIGNNHVNHDALRVIRWTGLETSVAVPGRTRKVTQYGFHSLRHTFASHCATAGVPKAVLLSILGTDSEIADKYYIHIGEEAQIKAVNAVSGDSLTSPQKRIEKALDFLKALPANHELQQLEAILR